MAFIKYNPELYTHLTPEGLYRILSPMDKVYCIVYNTSKTKRLLDYGTTELNGTDLMLSLKQFFSQLKATLIIQLSNTPLLKGRTRDISTQEYAVTLTNEVKDMNTQIDINMLLQSYRENTDLQVKNALLMAEQDNDRSSIKELAEAMPTIVQHAMPLVAMFFGKQMPAQPIAGPPAAPMPQAMDQNLLDAQQRLAAVLDTLAASTPDWLETLEALANKIRNAPDSAAFVATLKTFL